MIKYLGYTVIGLFVILIIFTVIKNNIRSKDFYLTNGRFVELPKTPNAVSTQTTYPEKLVEPMRFKNSINESKEKLLTALKRYGGYTISKDEGNIIQLVFMTKVMRFKDDAVFYFDEEEKLIHFRSASRIGYSDMGLNRKRYEEIKKYYEEE
jgi:uncharacterized protein (DUF1499 family)